MNPRVFREYDIRGNADRDLDDGFANDLGKAVGTHLKRAGAQKITLGRDCRVTSPRLHKALRSGIMSTGALCDFLERWLSQSVIDETNIEGTFDIDVRGDTKTNDGFFDALRDQTGLAVTPGHRDVTTLVVRPAPAT